MFCIFSVRGLCSWWTVRLCSKCRKGIYDTIYFVKILSGILAIIFALFILRREDKNRKVINTEEAS
ncbi:Uncharacterised protein [Clostridium paraputrificum]|nr:Uncharacterised protein [Clostridium paraputrificum]